MKRKRLDQVAYEYIVDQIDNKELWERENIIEQEIADELRMSRTPVREAFTRLVEDGYLEYTKNSGVRVKERERNNERIEVTIFTTEGYESVLLTEEQLLELSRQLQNDDRPIYVQSLFDEYYAVGFVVQGKTFNKYPRIYIVEGEKAE